LLAGGGALGLESSPEWLALPQHLRQAVSHTASRRRRENGGGGAGGGGADGDREGAWGPGQREPQLRGGRGGAAAGGGEGRLAEDDEAGLDRLLQEFHAAMQRAARRP
jgi:hypothetical protein